MSDLVGGSVVWNLDANNDKFNSQLDSASKSIQGLDGKIKAAQSGSQAFAAGLAVVGTAAVAFGVSSVHAYESAQVAQTKLATNLLNVKGNTQATVNELGKLASQLQNVGVIEDDVIKAGMSQLATFNLQGKTIGLLTPKIADMVAQLKGHNATAEDMVGINNLVGKVMTGNVGALSRYGVTLSETQAKLLKTGTETERANILNEVLAQNYGKVNEALRNTPQGQITALKNTFGDFQEIVGETIATGLTPFIKSLNDLMAAAGGPEGMMRKLTETFKALQPWMPVITGAIVGALIPAVYGLASAFIAMMVPLLPFIAVGVAVGLVFMAIKKAIEFLPPVVKVVSDAFAGFWADIQKVFSSIVAVMKDIGVFLVEVIKIWAAPFIWYHDNIVEPIMMLITALVLRAFFEIDKLVRPILESFSKFLSETWAGISGGVTTTFNAVKSFVVGVWNAISGAIQGPVNQARNTIQTNFNAVASFLTSTWNNIYNFFASIAGRIVDAITQPFRDAKNAIERIANEIKNAANNINPFVRHSPSLVDNVTKGIGIIKDQYNSLKDISLPSISGMAPAYAGMPTMSALSSDLGEGSGSRGGGDVNIYVDKIQNIEDVQTIDQKLGFRMLLKS